MGRSGQEALEVLKGPGQDFFSPMKRLHRFIPGQAPTAFGASDRKWHSWKVGCCTLCGSTHKSSNLLAFSTPQHWGCRTAVPV